jgi:hypothetical protein
MQQLLTHYNVKKIPTVKQLQVSRFYIDGFE